ncbi:MAG: ankyrin repeat domain-containing protein [Deltaproteobacteria bacterium]|nr:ankyrin repeat domain-containing protein [Deltaproteobacteria bacterium]
MEYIDHLSSDENLARPTSIALSPDGRHLYVTAYGARCMAILRRDQLTGYIKRLDNIPLKGAFAAHVSPNGRYVVCSDVKSGPDYYSGTNTLTLFARDHSTGGLTLLDSVRNEENSIDSLDKVVDICFSPNSEFVYVIGSRSAAVTAFRITDNEKLALVQSNKGQDQCFNGARGIAISPDGKYVYVASVDASTLAVLQRDVETGKISLKHIFKDEQGDVHGLGGVWDVTCSPDGRFIYTNAGRQQGEEHDDAVCTFERIADGTLSLVQELRTNEAPIGLAGGSRLRVSPDGKHMYALGCDSDSMVSFQRHPDTGKLTYLQTHSFRGLNNKYCYPGDLSISPDGAYVYVAGEGIGINGIILLKRLPWTKNSAAEMLYEAACSGNRSLLESAIKKGADVNAMGQGGYTALHWAAQENQRQAATFLLDAGADVNVRTGENGWTPLHIAAMRSSEDVGKILIDKGADLNVKNHNNRQTPLVVTQLNGHIDFAALLLDEGAKLDFRDRGGRTLLNQAATQGDIAFAELLIKKGADVDGKDRPGWTPLFSATRWHQTQMIEWLISKGADVNAKSRAGQTPLHMACGIGMLDIVELLLAHGADIQARTDTGDTPLSLAQEDEHADVVELLRKHGAKESAQATQSKEPIKEPQKNEQSIEDANKLSSELFEAIQSNNLERVKELVAQGVDLNVRDSRGNTPLTRVIKYEMGRLSIVEVLISGGADVNAKDRVRGGTPLHLAVAGGHKEVVKLLIASGADLNAKNRRDITPLDQAKLRGHTDIVEMLTEAAEEQEDN